jgi:hypothetical protein
LSCPDTSWSVQSYSWLTPWYFFPLL